jgi:predicted metalloprotease with PDZ domain
VKSARTSGCGILLVVSALVCLGAPHAQTLAPIVYTIRVPSPDTHVAEIEAVVPTEGRVTIDLMMPVWSPGYYRIEDYASRIRDLRAHTPDGRVLPIESIRKNRWHIRTGDAPAVVVSYDLTCTERSVTTNWVGSDLGVFNGAATFVTLVEEARRPHEVRFELPPAWPQAMTGLDAAPGGGAHRYRAPDYDTLVDSPIVAGALDVQVFDVEGTRHVLASGGDREGWDSPRAARDLEKMVRETRRFWGFLPFERYVFLIVFRPGGGGLEHKNSTLVTANRDGVRSPAGYDRWLGLVSHEYFHAFNVKRLRPIELDPFDYENEVRTTSLWMAEGVTTYYSDLMLARSGLRTESQLLASLSSRIAELQQAPGRLVQTLEQSSAGVWTNSFSGINPSDTTVSYYVKGQVVGFLLDASIRRATGGVKSLDDVMRLAYARYADERGFRAEEFRATAAEVAGTGLDDWFATALGSTKELDYAEALEWFGLRFRAPDGSDPTGSWQIEAREDASPAERDRLRAWFTGTP